MALCDWSSDVCSSDLCQLWLFRLSARLSVDDGRQVAVAPRASCTILSENDQNKHCFSIRTTCYRKCRNTTDHTIRYLQSIRMNSRVQAIRHLFSRLYIVSSSGIFTIDSCLNTSLIDLDFPTQMATSEIWFLWISAVVHCGLRNIGANPRLIRST